MTTKKRILLTFVAGISIGVLFFIIKISLQNSVTKYNLIEYSELKEISSENSELLVYVRKADCLPCKNIEPIINEIAESKIIKVVSIDLEKERGKIQKELNVEGTPTLIYMKNGVEKNRILGFTEKENILEMLQ